MTAAAETSTLESRVGHYYQMDDTYLVGREKVREFARAVQDYHPAHWNLAAAADLGYPDLVAPLTFTSTVQGVMMHDVSLLGVDESETAYHKTVRPEGEVRIAEGGTTRTPGTA